MQRLRRFKLSKYSSGQVKGDTVSTMAQLPSEFIDCLSLQKENTHAVDDPLSRNSNENSDIDVLPAEQSTSDKPSPDIQNNLMVQQEGK